MGYQLGGDGGKQRLSARRGGAQSTHILQLPHDRPGPRAVVADDAPVDQIHLRVDKEGRSGEGKARSMLLNRRQGGLVPA